MIYTKTGDHGTTSLVGGSRVNKDDHRVEAYGTVDELNSHIGLLAEMIRPLQGGYYDELKAVQHNLFTLQTLLATEDAAIYGRLPQLPEEEVEMLERQIDTITDQLPKLQNFVIAGGNLAGAQCHVARTVCRRAERRVVTLAREAVEESGNQAVRQSTDVILRYLNRLSDYLFVLGRRLVVMEGKEEDLYIS
jgi:cob(I)alamin adenosyltransferase